MRIAVLGADAWGSALTISLSTRYQRLILDVRDDTEYAAHHSIILFKKII